MMDILKTLLLSMLLAACLSASARAQDTSAGSSTRAPGSSPVNPAQETVPDTSTTRVSEQGHYRVSYTSKTNPIPLNRIHAWTLHLENTDGQPVDDARIAVYGGMPAHKHGFPTAPRVTGTLGNGDYLLEGIKFSMAGHWELWLNIRSGTLSDKAVINVVLP